MLALNFLGNAIYQFESDLPQKAALNSYYTVLSEEIVANLQEELPIAMLGYTSNASFEVIDLYGFAAPEKLSSFEYVYAATVQFFPY